MELTKPLDLFAIFQATKFMVTSYYFVSKDMKHSFNHIDQFNIEFFAQVEVF